MIVDVDTWRVVSLEVKLDRQALQDLELKRPLLGTQTVLVPTSQLAGASDVVVLKAELEKMEFCGGVPAQPREPRHEDEKQESTDKHQDA
jgi:hypothetical protein